MHCSASRSGWPSGGSPKPLKEMLRHGFRFNLLSAALISLLCYFLLPLLLNV
jgi:hypothetical protein